jgi:hypothetical protein
MFLTVNPPRRKPLETPAKGRPTQRLFSILLRQSVALGENARHFRHVLGSPSTKRDDRDGQAAAELGQRVVHARGQALARASEMAAST